jgi:hypothetical protein
VGVGGGRGKSQGNCGNAVAGTEFEGFCFQRGKWGIRDLRWLSRIGGSRIGGGGASNRGDDEN